MLELLLAATVTASVAEILERSPELRVFAWAEDENGTEQRGLLAALGPGGGVTCALSQCEWGACCVGWTRPADRVRAGKRALEGQGRSAPPSWLAPLATFLTGRTANGRWRFESIELQAPTRGLLGLLAPRGSQPASDWTSPLGAVRILEGEARSIAIRSGGAWSVSRLDARDFEIDPFADATAFAGRPATLLLAARFEGNQVAGGDFRLLLAADGRTIELARVGVWTSARVAPSRAPGRDPYPYTPSPNVMHQIVCEATLVPRLVGERLVLTEGRFYAPPRAIGCDPARELLLRAGAYCLRGAELVACQP